MSYTRSLLLIPALLVLGVFLTPDAFAGEKTCRKSDGTTVTVACDKFCPFGTTQISSTCGGGYTAPSGSLGGFPCCSPSELVCDLADSRSRLGIFAVEQDSSDGKPRLVLADVNGLGLTPPQFNAAPLFCRVRDSVSLDVLFEGVFLLEQVTMSSDLNKNSGLLVTPTANADGSRTLTWHYEVNNGNPTEALLWILRPQDPDPDNTGNQAAICVAEGTILNCGVRFGVDGNPSINDFSDTSLGLNQGEVFRFVVTFQPDGGQSPGTFTWGPCQSTTTDLTQGVICQIKNGSQVTLTRGKAVVQAALIVEIDAQPTFNAGTDNSGASVPVVYFGSNSIDASLINLASLKVNGQLVSIKNTTLSDTNSDGKSDLKVDFYKTEFATALNCQHNGDTIVAFSGTVGAAAANFSGSDTINVNNCPNAP